MPKCLAAIASVQAIPDNSFRVGYTAATDTPTKNWGGDFTPNTSLSIAANLANLKSKIVADALTQGVTILLTDVIVFGGPS